jgi:iron-sulfur cluster repair protein YtfE (RIC family)
VKSPVAGPRQADGSTQVLADLVDEIEQNYHESLKLELRRAERIADDVADRHGRRFPQSIELAGELKRLRVELEWHIWKEHADFFPLCRRPASRRPARRMEQHIRDLQRVIRHATELLRRILGLEHLIPAEWSELAAPLDNLERDARSYLETEESRLFPNALADVARRHRSKPGAG